MDVSETKETNPNSKPQPFNLIPSYQTQNQPLEYDFLLPVHAISGEAIDNVTDDEGEEAIDNVSDDEGEEAKETKEREYLNEVTTTVFLGEDKNIEALLNSIEEYVKSDSASDTDLNKEEENVEALLHSTGGLVLDSNEEIVESESAPDKDENKHKGCLIGDNDLAIRDADLTERDNDLAKRDTDLTEIDNDLTESEDDLTEREGDLTENEDDLLEQDDCLKVMTNLLLEVMTELPEGVQYEKGLEVYMLDFLSSYVYDVLEDASEYSVKLAGKKDIDMDDVILAIEMLQLKSTVSPSAPELIESQMRQRQFLQKTSTIEFTLPNIPLEPKILLQPKKRQRYCFHKPKSIEFNFPEVPKSKTIGNVHSKAQEKDKSTVTEYIGPLFGEVMIPKEDAVEPMDTDDAIMLAPTSSRVLASTSTYVFPSTSTYVFPSTSTYVFPSTSTYVAPPMSTDEDQSEIEYVDLSTHRFANFFTGRRSLNSNSSKSRKKPLLKLDKDKCPVSTSKDSEPFLTPLFSL